MKKLIYATLALCSLVVSSCAKEEIGDTATVALAGEWLVTVDAVDADGNVVIEDPFGLGTVQQLTYNTNSNVADQIYVDDMAAFWSYKVKVGANCSALTFSGKGDNESADYNPGECEVTITDGKVIVNGATSPQGRPVDKIEYYVSFSDDDNPANYGFECYRVSGYRRTGFNNGTE